MTNTVDINKIEYIDIQLAKGELTNLTKKPLQRGDAFNLEFNLKATHLYNLEKQLARVVLGVEITVVQEDEKTEAGAKFEIDNYFRYKGLKDITEKEGDKIRVHAQLVETIKALAYSTSRGIIFSRLAGTFLEGTILPVKMSTDL